MTAEQLLVKDTLGLSQLHRLGKRVYFCKTTGEVYDVLCAISHAQTVTKTFYDVSVYTAHYAEDGSKAVIYWEKCWRVDATDYAVILPPGFSILKKGVKHHAKNYRRNKAVR